MNKNILILLITISIIFLNLILIFVSADNDISHPTIGLSIDKLDLLTPSQSIQGQIIYSNFSIIKNIAINDNYSIPLEVHITGTDFYDSCSSGAKCPLTNQFSLTNIKYFAKNKNYSTINDPMADSEGYVPIFYGVNSEYLLIDIPNASIINPGEKVYIKFKETIPDICIGNFDTGSIYITGVDPTNKNNIADITCFKNSDCDDENNKTLDTCSGAGTQYGSCDYISINCNSNLDCEDNNNRTEDKCLNSGTSNSECTHEYINCFNDGECGVNSANLIYNCINLGTSLSYCVNHTNTDNLKIEAVIKYDFNSKNLIVKGYDENTSVNKTEKCLNKKCTLKNENYVLTNEYGNKLNIILQHSINNNQDSVIITKIKYNSDKEVKLKSNIFSLIDSKNKLSNEFIDQKRNIIANFDKKTKKTKIQIRENRKTNISIQDGLYLIELKTNNGSLSYRIKKNESSSHVLLNGQIDCNWRPYTDENGCYAIFGNKLVNFIIGGKNHPSCLQGNLLLGYNFNDNSCVSNSGFGIDGNFTLFKTYDECQKSCVISKGKVI